MIKNNRKLTFSVLTAVLVGILAGTALRGLSTNHQTGSLSSSSANHLPTLSSTDLGSLPQIRVIPQTQTSAVPSTTTTDPGTLPQEKILPQSNDPLFLSHMSSLFEAIKTGNPSLGLVSFFPLSAYVQVKALSDPSYDFYNRLIPAFNREVEALHQKYLNVLQSGAFEGVYVPEGNAQWILPGVEYNKGSYYRVYGTKLLFKSNGTEYSIPILSLISWRGEWYVVHITTFA